MVASAAQPETILTLAEVAAVCRVSTVACVRLWITKGVVGRAGPVAGGRLRHRVKLKAVVLPSGYHVRAGDLQDFLSVVSGTDVSFGTHVEKGGRRACGGAGRFSPGAPRRTSPPPPASLSAAPRAETVVGSNGKVYPV